MALPDKAIKNLFALPWWLFRVAIWIACRLLSLVLLRSPKVRFPKYHGKWFESSSKKKSSGKKSRDDDHDDDSRSSSSRKASKPSLSSLLSSASSSLTNTNKPMESEVHIAKINSNGNIDILSQNGNYLHSIILPDNAISVDTNGNGWIAVATDKGYVYVYDEKESKRHTFHHAMWSQGTNIVSVNWAGDDIIAKTSKGETELYNKMGMLKRKL